MKQFKSIIILLLITGSLQISCTTNKLQQNFTGIWKMKSVNGNGQSVAVFKVFDEKGNFSVLRSTPGGAFLSHKGVFKVKNDSVYHEQASNQRYDALYAFEDEGTLINFKFINHASVLRISFSANQKNGKQDAFTEIWEKVTVLNGRDDIVSR